MQAKQLIELKFDKNLVNSMIYTDEVINYKLLDAI